jgi:hypothetical protein
MLSLRTGENPLTRTFLRQAALFLSTVGVVAGCGSSSSPSSADWVGKTYLLDTPALTAAHWTKPQGFGGDIGAYVPQFLLGVEAGTGGDLTITLTSALAGAQDPCNLTTQVTASGASYPNIDIVAPSLPIRIYDSHKGTYVPSTARNVAFKSIFPAGAPAKEGELDATVDVAELYSLFYQIPDATKETVCAQFASYSVPCETCAFNSQPYCLTLQAVQIGATVAATPIKKVTASDIAATCP